LPAGKRIPVALKTGTTGGIGTVSRSAGRFDLYPHAPWEGHASGLMQPMWCSTCQQDVPPPETSGNGGKLRCGKCKQELAGEMAPAKIAPVAPRLTDDWELEAELRGVERLVNSLKSGGIERGDVTVRRDAPMQSYAHPTQEVAGSWHADRVLEPAANRPIEQENQRPKSHLLAWLILSIGLATFACGAVLLGWSFAGERDDLWPLGLPLALIGQAGLIIGLVLQLDGLWQSNRRTAETLSQLDGELSRVRHATTLLTTTKNASAQSFYAHMAEGANPQLLLADLKGQLDLLAQQMGSQRR